MGALAEYRQADAYFRDHAARFPNFAAFTRDVSSVRSRIVGALMLLGQRKEAISLAEESRRAAEARAKNDPEDAETARDAVLNNNNLGNYLTQDGQFAQARHYLERALALGEERGRRFPNDPMVAADLSSAENNLGILYVKWNKPGEAVGHFQRSLTIRGKALESDPKNARLQWRQAKTSNALAQVWETLQQWKQAARMYENASAIWSGLQKAGTLAEADGKEAERTAVKAAALLGR